MDKTKKYLAAFIAAATVLTMVGCGEKETADSKASTSNTQSTADNTADKGTSKRTESVTEEKKAPAGKLEDRPKLTIELDGGKTFTYNGESFKDVYQQLTDLGLVTDEAKAEYEEKGSFSDGHLKASNGTLFRVEYLPNRNQLIIKTGNGVHDKVAWDIKIGKINNKTTIGDLIDMGATAVEVPMEHGNGYETASYLLTSENFETKGISIDAKGGRTLLPEDLVVEGIIITYSGVEE